MPEDNGDDYEFRWSDIFAMIIAAFWVAAPYVLGLIAFVALVTWLLRAIAF